MSFSNVQLSAEGRNNSQHCWPNKSLTGFKLCTTTRNNTQQHATICNMVCKRTQHVTSNNVWSCWPTKLRPFARVSMVLLFCCCCFCVSLVHVFSQNDRQTTSLSREMFMLQVNSIHFKVIQPRLILNFPCLLALTIHKIMAKRQRKFRINLWFKNFNLNLILTCNVFYLGR